MERTNEEIEQEDYEYRMKESETRLGKVSNDFEDIDFKIGIGLGEFKHAFNRLPKNQEEFEEFAHLCEKGMNSQLDWGIIIQCAKEQMTSK